MRQKVATEMNLPWRSVESMHWKMGEEEMTARAKTPVLSSSAIKDYIADSQPLNAHTST